MPDWGCGACNRGHQLVKWKSHCSCKKKKKMFYSAPYHFATDRAMKLFKKKCFPNKNKKAYIEHHITHHKKERCFIYGQKGH